MRQCIHRPTVNFNVKKIEHQAGNIDHGGQSRTGRNRFTAGVRTFRGGFVSGIPAADASLRIADASLRIADASLRIADASLRIPAHPCASLRIPAHQ
ncbi:MAG: hypothetical protein JXX14_04805 [Deltaproteobacteria bacterium]|nr:hypothetical protein [Deltaproteobacteria bacterium]